MHSIIFPDFGVTRCRPRQLKSYLEVQAENLAGLFTSRKNRCRLLYVSYACTSTPLFLPELSFATPNCGELPKTPPGVTQRGARHALNTCQMIDTPQCARMRILTPLNETSEDECRTMYLVWNDPGRAERMFEDAPRKTR